MPASVAGWSLIIRRTCGITSVTAATPVCSMTRLVARLPENTIERRRSSRSVWVAADLGPRVRVLVAVLVELEPLPRHHRSKSGCTATSRSRSSAIAAIATGTFIRLAASTGSSASCSHHVVPSSAPSQTPTTSRTRPP